MHVAIFSEPYLSLVLSGVKTVESRFSRNRCAPFGEVASGDVILIKQVSGPIRGVVLARKAWSYKLTSEPLNRLRERFGEGIKADDAFWEAQADAEYATLIELDCPAPIEPFEIDKRDRRGWVALHSNQTDLIFS